MNRQNLLKVICILLIIPITIEARELSLDEAISLADSLNPEIQLKQSQIIELHAKKDQAKSLYRPKADAAIYYTRYGKTPQGKKLILGDSENDFLTGISVKQPLYDGGRAKNTIASLEKQTSIEKKSLTQTKINLRHRVTTAYFELQRIVLYVKVYNELYGRIKQQLDVAEVKYHAGNGSDLDVIRLKTDLLSVTSQIQSFDHKRKVKEYELAQSIGTTDQVTISTTEVDTIDTAYQMVSCNIDSLFAKTLSIKMLLDQEKKNKIDQKVMESSYLPSLVANGAFNIENGTPVPDHPNWSLGLYASIPLYRGNSRRAKRTQFQEKDFQINAQLNQKKIKIQSQYLSLKALLKEQKEKIKISAKILKLGKETNRLAELRYESGTLSSFELLDSQNKLSRLKLAYSNTIINYRLIIEDLAALCMYKKIGKNGGVQ